MILADNAGKASEEIAGKHRRREIAHESVPAASGTAGQLGTKFCDYKGMLPSPGPNQT
jgi:hypothetical protein